jgi:hypothetical protein
MITFLGSEFFFLFVQLVSFMLKLIKPNTMGKTKKLDEDWQVECTSLKQRFSKLLEHEHLCDCSFVMGEQLSQEIKAHKVVLAAASPVFETMFFGSMVYDNDQPIKVVDIDFKTFVAMLM